MVLNYKTIKTIDKTDNKCLQIFILLYFAPIELALGRSDKHRQTDNKKTFFGACHIFL